MSHSLEYQASFLRGFRKLPPAIRQRLLPDVEALSDDPRPPALKGKLRGLRRTRVGDYRIVYQVDDDAMTVRLIAVGDRDDIYDEAARMR